MTDFVTFTRKLTPPTTYPHDSAQYFVNFNSEWLPMVLGALFVLWDMGAWEGSNDDILAAQSKASELLDMSGEVYGQIHIIAQDGAVRTLWLTLVSGQTAAAIYIEDSAGNIIFRVPASGSDVEVKGLFVNKTSFPTVFISGTPPTGRSVVFQSAQSNRWGVGATSAAESGGNAGSDFNINRFNDAGAFVDTPILIRRSDGMIFIGPGPNISVNGTNLGFFGSAPITKPTVTGSRGGNAALASLLTTLANLGLIIDSTTV